MNLLIRLDAWAGKTLFHPPIILVCQLTRQSQYALSRALWFFAACHATYYAMAQGAGWFWSIFLWFFVLSMLLSAAIRPDRPARSSGFMRALFWASLISGVISTAATGIITNATVRSIIILFAEYAATIRTLPPRKPRESKAAGLREQAH